MEMLTFEAMALKSREFSAKAGIPIRFHIGDRIRVFSCAGSRVKAGWIGTVVDESLAPWVAFDKRSGVGDPSNPFGIPGWRPDHMECLTQDQLLPLP